MERWEFHKGPYIFCQSHFERWANSLRSAIDTQALEVKAAIIAFIYWVADRSGDCPIAAKDEILGF